MLFNIFGCGALGVEYQCKDIPFFPGAPLAPESLRSQGKKPTELYKAEEGLPDTVHHNF